MKEGVEFSYAGIKSTDMGLINVQVSGGLFEEPFLAEKEIREIKIRGNDKPYFQGVERSPLVFSLQFAFEDKYDHEKIRQVARWLDQDYYKPFFTTDNPDRIFYCMLHSSSQLIHNGAKEGYVEIEMRCDSPYSYSPQYTSEWYEIKSNPLIITETQGDFQNGSLKNMIVSHNGLQLGIKKPIWRDIKRKKWGELKNAEYIAD